MKKQKEQQEIIDLDSFDDDISLWQMIPSGTNKGTGLSLLKTYCDAALNSRAKLKSMLITGTSGLQLKITANAFLRGLGLEKVNITDAALLQSVFDVHIFFCGDEYEGYVITNIEKTIPSVKSYLCGLLKKQQLKPYNYMEQRHDVFDVPGPVLLTSLNPKKLAGSILDSIQNTVQLEGYSSEELTLVTLQRLKYAKIEYENETVLKDIVQYGNNEYDKVITFLGLCIVVMQSKCRQELMLCDVVKAARLNKLPVIDDHFEDTIPF